MPTSAWPPLQADFSALSSASQVVISQIYGGGGNSGAPYKNDFIELFNRSGSTVSLTGWSIQYASATGTGTYATAGTFAVTVTVTDEDGGQGSATAAVGVETPLAAAQDVMGQVRGLGAAGELPPQLVTPLLATLSAAARQIQRGDETAAIGQLDAFLNQVDAAVRSGQLASGAASSLRVAIERIEGVLQ